MASIVYDKQSILSIVIENKVRKELVDLNLGLSFLIDSFPGRSVVVMVSEHGF